MEHPDDSQRAGYTMKTLIQRLKSTRAESLIETMAAILIFTFASILFLSLVSAAADINLSVKKADESFQTQQVSTETLSGTPTQATAVLQLWTDENKNGLFEDGELTHLDEINVTLYRSEGEDPLYVYEPGEAQP